MLSAGVLTILHYHNDYILYYYCGNLFDLIFCNDRKKNKQIKHKIVKIFLARL